MNKILEKIDMDKEVLSAMPKNNKKNISKYIQYVQELKKEYEWYTVTESEQQKQRHIERIEEITLEISDLANEIVMFNKIFG